MSLDVVAKILHEIGGKAFITLDGGAFRARIMEDVAGHLDEVYEDLDEAEFDVEVELEWDPDPRQVAVTIRAVSADFDQLRRLYAYQLNSRERTSLLRELVARKRQLEAASVKSKPKVIVRKKSDNSYDLHVAAQKLDVTSEWFKKNIPCTGYNCAGGDDSSRSFDFRYDKKLVDRLSKIKNACYDACDLRFIADLCCEGDTEWAQEIMESLNSHRKDE